MRALILAFALAACGQSTAPAPEAQVATISGLDLSGHLIAQGADFRLDSAPDIGVVLHYPETETTVSGPYVLPQATDTGALLESQGISLTLTPGACTLDGVNYAMRASVTIPNARPADGCAFVRWDHHLVELIPEIDACIAASPETRTVSYAARSGEDEVTVYLQGGVVFVECKVQGGQATVTRAPDPVPIGGVGEALFVRAPGENPGGECYEAPEVKNTSGELLGWMLDPMGC